MSNSPDPWGSGTVEIATWKVIPAGIVGLPKAHPLMKPLFMIKSLRLDLAQLRSTLPIRAYGHCTKVFMPDGRGVSYWGHRQKGLEFIRVW